jgi:hypothetical protein
VNVEQGWIEWNGGECPEGLIVDARLRDGFVFKSEPSERFCASILGEPCSAHMCNWQHDGSDGDIIAYRIVKQESGK